MSDEPISKTPMVLGGDEKDDGSPMVMDRPGWVQERPPVGEVAAVESVDGRDDPTVINQLATDGSGRKAEAGTPDTIDPETGYSTGSTSPAKLVVQEEATPEKSDEASTSTTVGSGDDEASTSTTAGSGDNSVPPSEVASKP